LLEKRDSLSFNFIEIASNKILENLKKMEIALQSRLQKDFNDELGEVQYNLTEREGLKFISIPTSSKIILGVMDRDKDHTPFFNRIASFLKDENRI